jgi:hypothetical protein
MSSYPTAGQKVQKGVNRIKAKLAGYQGPAR